MALTDVDAALAAMLAPEDSRYIIICRECRHCWPYQRDSKTVKASRRGQGTCPDCGTEVELVVDAKEDES